MASETVRVNSEPAAESVGSAGELSAALERYKAQFEALRARRVPEPEWLEGRRLLAMARFEESGFPSTKQEQWRFTPVAPIARARFSLAPPGGAEPDAVGDLSLGGELEGPRLVFVNGRQAASLSKPAPDDGVRVLTLMEALAEEPALLEAHLAREAEAAGRPFAALNSALFEDAAVVRVKAGRVAAAPIHLAFLASAPGARPVVAYPRVLVVLERGSQATVVESFEGPDGESCFTNVVTEFVLEDAAVLDHYRVQREGSSAFHVGALAVVQGRDSRFASLSLAFGAVLARYDVWQRFAGEGGECALNGLFMAGGSQHTDTHTLIDHAVPRCVSRELYKGILDGRSRGVFHGTVLVREQAQKTDAHQVNKNLLLSREALVNSTPALEIHADDVKCRHGSTTGQLDPAALFYLRSRGLGEAQARSLLIHGFASDLVGKVAVPALRQGLEHYLQDHLPSRMEGLEEATA